jgi:hypothetical protein
MLPDLEKLKKSIKGSHADPKVKSRDQSSEKSRDSDYSNNSSKAIDSIALWGDNLPCVLHPNVNEKTAHTNAQCRSQQKIRLENRSLYAMLPDLEKLKKSIKGSHADPKVKNISKKLSASGNSFIYALVFLVSYCAVMMAFLICCMYIYQKCLRLIVLKLVVVQALTLDQIY